MIVTKAVNMAKMMDIPVLGLVENYSYFQCPDCGAKHAIFGESQLDSVAAELGVPVLARLPIDPALAAAFDAGQIEQVEKNPMAELLERLPNVRLLGRRAPGEVPDYLARFDVCLNLLRRSEQGNDVVPCRIYEYLSSGKPVVSMLFPEQVEHFPDVVYGAHSPEEFAALCRRALAETGDWAKNRRREHGAAAAWSARADEVTRILGTTGLY